MRRVTHSSTGATGKSTRHAAVVAKRRWRVLQEAEHPRVLIPELCRLFYQLGWVTGTGGGISVRRGLVPAFSFSLRLEQSRLRLPSTVSSSLGCDNHAKRFDRRRGECLSGEADVRSAVSVSAECATPCWQMEAGAEFSLKALAGCYRRLWTASFPRQRAEFEKGKNRYLIKATNQRRFLRKIRLLLSFTNFICLVIVIFMC